MSRLSPSSFFSAGWRSRGKSFGEVLADTVDKRKNQTVLPKLDGDVVLQSLQKKASPTSVGGG